MGLASIAFSALKTGATAIGRAVGLIAPAVTKVAPRLAGVGATIGATVGGVAIGEALFGGNGAPAGGQLQAIAEAGGQVTQLANGQFMAVAPNGDMQIFNRNGQPRRPTSIIPAGQPLPGGAIVVATRNNGAQIGIVKKRTRRRFGSEIERTRDTVKAAQQLVNLCKGAKR